MIGVYFSGTGNTKFCIDKFLKEYDHSEDSFSIEDNRTLKEIENHNEIVIGYPVQYSMNNITLTNGIAFSGDKCTMCYRCISKCPKQAITLLGKEVIDQNDICRYL